VFDLRLPTCRRQYPGGPLGLDRSWDGLFQPFPCTQRRRPSPYTCKVGDHIGLFEACSTFTGDYGLSARRVAKATRLSRRLRRFRYLHRRSDSYRLERPSCRVGLAPTEDQHLTRFTAHVESRCGAVVLGSAYLFPALSFAGASLASPWLRFHIPLIKPGGRFSRTRLSDKALLHILLHTFAHERLPLRSRKPVQSQLLVQMLVGEPCCSLTPYLELHAQPLTHPIAKVAVDVPIGFSHCPKAKVVGPTL
jgi:hypothetical protein